MSKQILEIKYIQQLCCKSPKTLIQMDIHKAYDSVNLSVLNLFIENDDHFDPEDLEEWHLQYRDLMHLNYDFNGNIIYRTRGLPQGSKLSPMLFNYYVHKILEYDDDEIIPENTIIYADNIFMVINSIDDILISNIIEKIRKHFEGFDLYFEDESINILKFDKINIPNINKKLKLENETKILGIYYKAENNTLNINMNKILFELKNTIPNSGIRINKFAKKFIIPKYKYYYEICNNLDKIYKSNLANDFDKWFFKIFHKWLQEKIITLKISKRFMQQIAFPVIDDTNKFYLQDYYTYHWTFEDSDNDNDEYLSRLKFLATNIRDKDVYLDRNTICYLILDRGTINFDIFPKNTHNSRKNIWDNLDMLYYLLKSNQNLYLTFIK